VARLKLAKKRGQGGARRGAVVAAVAGFVVLCGLLLLVAGAPGLRCGGESRAEAAARKVLSALKAINSADRDLESGNYGNARRRVQSAQKALTGALSELQAGAE